MKWIKLKDELPIENERVIIFTSHGQIEIGSYGKHPDYDEPKRWKLDDGFREDYNYCKYWMKLPTEPM